jgi:hypothetical protein
MPSIYVQFRSGPLDNTDEAVVYPLLKKSDSSDNKFHWAFAIAKVNENDPKNRLLASLLQALGFSWDANSTATHDFFYADKDTEDRWLVPLLVHEISGGTKLFTDDTFPEDLNPTGSPTDKLTLLPPRGSEDPKRLKLAAAATTIVGNHLRSFGVSFFKFEVGYVHFRLAASGQETTEPGFQLQLQLKGETLPVTSSPGHPQTAWFQIAGLSGKVALNLPNEVADRFVIEHTGGWGGSIRANGVRKNAVATAPEVRPNNHVFNPKDDRRTRLKLDNGALSLVANQAATPTTPEHQKYLLAIELFPAVRFHPIRGLPLSVTVASEVLSARFRRIAPDSDESRFDVHLRPGHPCFRVTVSGPMIQAATGGASSDWLTLVEPAEQIVKVQVEQVNDLMTYSFQICLPLKADEVPWEKPEFQLLDEIEYPLLAWPGVGLPKLTEILDRVRTFLEELREAIDSLTLDFDVSFPDVGRLPTFPGFAIEKVENLPSPELPGVKVPRLTIGKLFDDIPDIVPPEVPGLGVSEPQVDFSRLKLRIRHAIKLPSVNKIDGFEITCDNPWPGAPERLEIGDVLEVYFEKMRYPDFQIVEILDLDPLKLRLSLKLARPDGLEIPTVDLPKVSMHWRRPELTYLRRIKSLEKIGGKFQIDLEGPEWSLDKPDLGLFIPKLGDLIDVSTSISLPLVQSYLKDLLGELPSVDFQLNIPDFGFQRLQIPLTSVIEHGLPVPFELSLRIPRPNVELPDAPILKLWLAVAINLHDLRLLSNRVYFYLPQVESGHDPVLVQPVRQQSVDLDIFTLSFPLRNEIKRLPNKDDHDGYLDITDREFQIDLKYGTAPEPNPPARIGAFFPGGMDERAVQLGQEQIEALPEDDPAKGRLRREYTRRFRLELQKIDPKIWPEESATGLYFRLNAKGVTFNALLVKTEVEIDTSGHDIDDDKKKASGVIKPFKLNPQDKQGELRSRVVIIDSELREATVFAKTFVPGVENLLALVQVSLKQSKRGALPDVIASLQLERPDDTPISEFSISQLELKLKRLELGLAWYREQKDWDYWAIADGSIGFTGAADLIPDLDGLRAPAIEVIGLNLRKMNLRQIRIPIELEKPVRFEILNGLFAVELGDLTIGWEFVGGIPRPRLLACELAKFEFQKPGAMQVNVRVGGLNIEFDPNMKARIRLPSRLGMEVILGSSARFDGEVGWVDDNVERYFFASGAIALEGFPEAKALLKFGTGRKLNGQRQMNVVLYGAIEREYQVYAGVVVKEMGLGIGLNNRLAAIPPAPSADAIIRKIDTIRPERIDSWSFVREDGFYLSIIGSVFLAEKQGLPDVINAYVANLVVSFDTNFDLVAAGKVWLSCSMNGVKEHLQNPALVGAMVLSPRQQKLEVAVESRPNPFIEANDFLKKLFNKGRIRFTFRLTPQLLDYYLEEVSYRDRMYGVDFEFIGSYRFAIHKQAVLLRSDLAATGTLSRSLRAGPGGFDFHGHVRLAVGYGGLLSLSGAMAYAYLDASATFRVAAWIEIGFSKSFKVCGERFTISWSVTFRARSPSLELTLRGNVGLNDNAGGLIGADCMVGINFSICGYRLNVSGRLSHNPEIYDDVRAQVAAFERSLEQAIRANDQSRAENARLESDAVTEGAFALTAAHAPVVAGLEAIPAADPYKALCEACVPKSLAPGQHEEWLHYRRTGDDKPYHLLLPRSREQWLARAYAVIEGVVFDPGNKLLHVSCKSHGLKTDPKSDGISATRIGLLGLRGNNAASRAAADRLNAIWPLKSTGDSGFALDVSALNGALSGLDALVGGTWYVPREGLEGASGSGVTSELQRAPHLIQDVERIVVRTGDWIKIKSATTDGMILHIEVDTKLPPFVQGQRIVVREPGPGGKIKDFGRIHASGAEDAPDVTLVVATRVNDQQLDVLVPSHAGQPSSWEGWQLAAAKEIATFWNARNRAAAVRRKLIDHKQYQELTSDSSMLVDSAAAADQLGQDQGPDYSSFRLVSDPRYESTERHWMPLEDQFLLPDEILSTRFRPIEDLDEASSGEIRQIQEYVAARDRLRLFQMHEGLDFEPADELQQSRARLTQLMIEDLSRDIGPQTFGERVTEPMEGKSAESSLVYGLAFKLGEESLTDDDRVFVRRTGGAATAISVAEPDKEAESTATSRMDDIRPLPARQEFVIDSRSEAANAKERARVVVKLPLGFGKRILQQNLEQLGRLQIYRQFSWEREPRLLRDHIRPDINFLPQINPVHTGLSGTVAASGEITINGVRKGLTSDDLVGLLIRLLVRRQTGTETKYFRIIGVNDNRIQVAHTDGLIPNSNEPITFDIVAAGLIVPSPYVFSDEFAVEDRRLTDPEIVAQGLLPHQLKVTYSVRVAPHGDSGAVADLRAERDKGRVADWDSISLHIPEPDQFPRRLAAVVPADSLVLNGSPVFGPTGRDWFEFQLVSMVGEAPATAMLGERPLNDGDFELWAAERPLEQTGFYAGEDGAAGAETSVDNSSITTDQVATEQQFESADGKFQVAVEFPQGRFGEPVFRIRDAAHVFRPGMAYRLFVRPAQRSEFNLLMPISLIVVRRLPSAWDGSVRYRLVEQLELFPDATVNRLLKRELALLEPHSFSVDDLFQDGSNALRCVWQSLSLLDGGVEIVVRDFDDSGFTHRQLCEVIEEDRYRELKRDFSNGSYWELARRPRRERVAGDAGLPPPPTPSQEELIKCFLTRPNLADHDIFRRMLDNYQRLVSSMPWGYVSNGSFDAGITKIGVSSGCGLLGKDDRVTFAGDPNVYVVATVELVDPDTGDVTPRVKSITLAEGLKKNLGEKVAIAVFAEWQQIAVAAVDFLASVNLFLKSPLNLHRPHVEKMAEALSRTLRMILLGLRPSGKITESTQPADVSKSLPEYLKELRDNEIALRRLLEESEQAAPGDMALDADGKATFLDRDTARKLAGFVRRRLAIADDVVSLRAPANSGSSQLSGNHTRLARQAEWVRTRDEANSFFATPAEQDSRLPLKKRFTDLVQEQHVAGLAAAFEKIFDALWTELTGEPAKQAYAKVLPRAAGLSRFLGDLQGRLRQSGASLLKRPHHELLTTTSVTEGVQAQETPLSAYLPDSARGESPDKLPPLPSPRLVELPLRVARLATINKSGQVDVWTADGGSPDKHRLRRLHRLDAKDKKDDEGGNYLTQLRHDNGEHLLLTLKSGGTAQLWDLLRGTRIRRLRNRQASDDGYTTNAASFAQTPVGLRFITADNKGDVDVVRFWDREIDAPTATFQRKLIDGEKASMFSSVAYDDEECLVAAGTADGHVVLWRDLGKGDQFNIPVRNSKGQPHSGIKLDGEDASVTHVLFITVPEGTRLIAAQGRELHIIDPEQRTLIDTWAVDSAITSLAFDRVQLQLAVGASDGNVRYWNWPDRKAMKLPTSGTASGYHVNGEHFRDDKTINVDAGSGTVLPGEAVTFSGDSTVYVVETVVGGDTVRQIRLSNGLKQDLAHGAAINRVISRAHVDYLHSQNRSWLVTAFETENQPSRIWMFDDQEGEWKHVQIVPGTGNARDVAIALMPAINSSTSQGVNALFHLWERMGFALDVAVVDERNQLLPPRDLNEHVNAVRATFKTNGEEPHTVFVLNPREPDSDYRPDDRVGFSFLNVAVVPDEFHKLCMATGPKWQGTAELANESGQGVAVLNIEPRALPNGASHLVVLSGPAEGTAVKIAETLDEPGPLKIKLVSPFVEDQLGGPNELSVVAVVNHEEYRAIKEWLEFRNVMGSFKPDDADFITARAVIELLHIREPARYIGLAAPDEQLGTLLEAQDEVAQDGVDPRLRELTDLAVEPMAERWLTVPASGGWSHSVWTVPDRKGHRFEGAVRRVSRYEPLLRWALQDQSPFDVPSDTEVAAGTVAGIDGTDLILPEGDHFAIAPRHLNRFPLSVEISKGPGAGQHRLIHVYDTESRKIKIDPGDPWLGEAITSESHYRIIAHGDKWALIELPPALDPQRGEGPKPLTVYQYPHPRRIQFTYQLPLEGARSIYNQISQIRTGYRGTEPAFRYLILDRPPGDPRRLERLLKATVLISEALPAPMIRYAMREVNQETRIRLLRHERLLTLPDLPFFYRYRLDVRALFQSRPQERERLADADLLPSDPNRSPLAERLPSRLAVHQPAMQIGADALLIEGDCQGPDDPNNKLQIKLKLPTPHYNLIENAQGRAVRFEATRKTDGRRVVRNIALASWPSGEFGDVATVEVDEELDGDRPGAGWTYRLHRHEHDVTIHVVANDDHLTREERHAEPEPLCISFQSLQADGSISSVTLRAGRLPDFGLNYGLFWKLRLDAGADAFSPAGMVSLPWNADYQPDDHLPDFMPYVKLYSELVAASEDVYLRLPEAKTEAAATLKALLLTLVGDEGFDPLKNATTVTVMLVEGSLHWNDNSGSDGDLTEIGQSKSFPVAPGFDLKLGTTSLAPAVIRVGINDALGRVLVRVKAGNKLPLPIEMLRPGGVGESDDSTVAYRIRFRVLVGSKAEMFNEADRFFLLGIRDGFPTKAIQFRVES